MSNIINEHFQLILTLFALVSVLFPIFKWIIKINCGLSSVETNITKIIHELTPNSGSSIKDKINKIENDHLENKRMIDNIYHLQKWLLDLSDKMLFKADKDGMWTWVNESLIEKLKQNEQFLLNSGWKNYIVSSDRLRVITEWDKCIKDKKNICILCNIVTRGSDHKDCIINAAIIANILNDGTYAGWIRMATNTFIPPSHHSFDQ